MKKKVVTKNAKTREELAMPYKHLTINERLVQSDAIDLTDNCIIEERGDYMILIPIDKTKKIQPEKKKRKQ